jgi:hypothetical protein
MPFVSAGVSNTGFIHYKEANKCAKGMMRYDELLQSEKNGDSMPVAPTAHIDLSNKQGAA